MLTKTLRVSSPKKIHRILVRVKIHRILPTMMTRNLLRSLLHHSTIYYHRLQQTILETKLRQPHPQLRQETAPQDLLKPTEKNHQQPQVLAALETNLQVGVFHQESTHKVCLDRLRNSNRLLNHLLVAGILAELAGILADILRHLLLVVNHHHHLMVQSWEVGNG